MNTCSGRIVDRRPVVQTHLARGDQPEALVELAELARHTRLVCFSIFCAVFAALGPFLREIYLAVRAAGHARL